MNERCTEFTARLAEAALGPAGALAPLAADPHATDCRECRAALAREAALERLFARVPRPAQPAHLVAAVLRGVADERARRHAGAPEETELDALLERVPGPDVPPDLARRVLAGLEVERAPDLRRAPPRRRLLVLAAALAGALGAWAWSRRAAADEAELAPEAELAALEGDAELLAYATERWELLHDPDLDVWLASLAPTDALLVEYADDVVWTEEEAR